MTELATHSPLTEALARLLGELRPDLPESVRTSLVVEVIDSAAPWFWSEEWYYLRQSLWPLVVDVVRQTAKRIPYDEKRRRDVEAARPRPGDFPGRAGRAA